MMRIRLDASSGGLVTYGRIPTFDPPPAVITWGVRTFVLASRALRPDGAEALYREAFAVALVDVEAPG